MSDRRPHQGPRCSKRIPLLAKADELFSRGMELIRSKEPNPDFAWEYSDNAARIFEQAAVSYRDLGLGIKARDAWSRSAACHRALAAESDGLARFCDEKRDAIPVLWAYEPGGEP